MSETSLALHLSHTPSSVVRLLQVLTRGGDSGSISLLSVRLGDRRRRLAFKEKQTVNIPEVPRDLSQELWPLVVLAILSDEPLLTPLLLLSKKHVWSQR